MDHQIPIDEVVADPFDQTENLGKDCCNPLLAQPPWIFGASRKNSAGIDLTSHSTTVDLYREMDYFRDINWRAQPSEHLTDSLSEKAIVVSPVDAKSVVGTVVQSNPRMVDRAIEIAWHAIARWEQSQPQIRSEILNRIADCFERNRAELMALMIRETGKTVADALAEVRESVDFCRFYANEALRIQSISTGSKARGIVACISPWNFPLAIFTGQITGALAAANVVIAKPAEQSPLTAAKAVELMHQSGVPPQVLQILLGAGENIGESLVSDPRIAAVNFTGSGATARAIHQAIATKGNQNAVLVAETGGINAMVVDSTALPEQAVRDIIVSAFQSCGQRCSAVRMVYLQSEIKQQVLEMLYGAMEHLTVGDPWDIETDVGPVIDNEAHLSICNYLRHMEQSGYPIFQSSHRCSLGGFFVAPCVIEVPGIEALEKEVFGPVLHVASYLSQDLPSVIQAINDTGYGLTFGLHTRIDRRVQQLTESIVAGNIYVNRNQIGAVVGCQPFGGRGLSGTGPKSGGRHYVANFRCFTASKGEIMKVLSYPRGSSHYDFAKLNKLHAVWQRQTERYNSIASALTDDALALNILKQTVEAIESPVNLDGPTGESNRLYTQHRGIFVCIGSLLHAIQALAAGNAVLAVGIEKNVCKRLRRSGAAILDSEFVPDEASLKTCDSFAGIALHGCDEKFVRKLRQEIATLDGAIRQFITDPFAPWQFVTEKTHCIDTTAAGGNAKLLIESGS